MNQHASLASLYATLQAERERTFTPEALRLNKTQRRELVEGFDPDQTVKPGDRVDGFTLERAEGGGVTLEELTAEGPVLLLFFRFAGCPACNLALPYYDRTLRPALEQRGVRLVAVSPQLPDRLRDIVDRHQLGFPVASDRDNALGRRFGLLFEPNAENKAAAEASGNFIGDVTGTGSWELPFPAAILIDPSHVVRFAAISPDWLDRVESDAVIAAVDAVLAPAEAP
jgi:peroxiredoxin